MAAVVLVHSPLAGPACWGPVAAELERRGLDAVVPGIDPPERTSPPWWPVAAGQVATALDQANRGDGPTGATSDEVVLVGHSGAGPRLPAIADRLLEPGWRTVAALFVDAGLPRPGVSPADTLPPDLRAHLEQLTDGDGMLPPWPQWWTAATVAALVPDPTVRARVLGECRPVPRALFDEQVPVPDEWPGRSACAYLSFTYEEEAAEADGRGWPVARMPGQHLHPVVEPGGVADALMLLLGALGIRP
ncbi:MAG: hypothetical protein WKF43_05295 [Acidimicrobiales bacterium]